ncbi:MAG: leucine--tRNA ligase [Candidatus Pacebacteria bacterium]|nr:leucine--tRNA ligase [Candidatus Paceibacterota bacterium]MCF7863095.1 leucine--tRNA ligase [Candidatus Paceibacterota bacterium]
MKNYDHKKIEKKWQTEWEKKNLYKAKEKGKKFYSLIEFPYPSGAGLHVGHIRSNTAMDIVSRKRRMEGYNVLFPIGWDAFGLPTENYAIKTGVHPIKVTKQNTDAFRKQLKEIGFSFDWSREVDTTDPKYYKWTQWIFLQFYKKGLAYKAKTYINWCPKDKIGLANEEVVDGKCERCGTDTEKREKEQWMLAITKYADRLDKDLDLVDYPDRVKLSQRNWIGKSEGMLFTAPVKDMDLEIETFSAHFEAFCADTFVVIAPDHPLLQTLVSGVKNEKEILLTAKKMVQDRSKAGFEQKEPTGIFTGKYIVDPVGNGNLPIWVASYALADYGTGIVKCSAHDVRDFAFAKKYNIPLKPVLFPEDKDLAKKVLNLELCFSDMQKGILKAPNIFAGRIAGETREEIIKYLEEKGLAEKRSSYKIRDWVFSRQRYWGEPIPIIHCEHCGMVPVPEKDLPIVLPKVKSYQPTDTGESPLANIKEWVNVKCPKCKMSAKRETDTMPNWAGSSWYYLRYMDSKNTKSFADSKKIKYWSPVDWYNGGMEHTTLHLLYSRFWHKFLYDLKLVPTIEPYKKRTSHGMILAEDGVKMSKSIGNTVNPADIVRLYGADTLRLYEMFMGPFEDAVNWNTNSIIGSRRFLEKVWRVGVSFNDKKKKKDPSSPKNSLSVEKVLHKTIKKVSEDIENMRFNTAVSNMMIFISEIEKALGSGEAVPKESFKKFLQVLSPFAPHITEELWNIFGEKKSIHISKWPKWSEKMLEENEVKIVIQVNGKVRGEMYIGIEEDEESVKAKATKENSVLKYLEGNVVKRIIYVKGRLVNIVC